MNWKSYSDLYHDLMCWNASLPPFDAVVGIPRSGMIPASMLAQIRNCPLASLDHFVEHGVYRGGERCPQVEVQTVLVLEDSCGRGLGLIEARQLLADKPVRALFGAVYPTPEAVPQCDVHCEAITTPRVWEWNLFHHRHVLAGAVVDIDGVLCPDPTPEENDDGARYRRFLSDVRPLVVPTVEIGTLCTNRIERYRPETVAWLDRYSISRGRLVMAPYASQEERRRASRYAEDKAQCVLDNHAHLMIESDPSLAAKINRLSKVPAFCPVTSQFFS